MKKYTVYVNENRKFNGCKYFTYKELACKFSGVIKLHDGFLEKLNFLRDIVGFSLIPNSVCRIPEYNEAIGGHKRSLHLTENPVHPTNGSMAADISTIGWSDEKKRVFIQTAWQLDWSIGIMGGAYHIDRRVDIGLKEATFKYAGVDNSKELKWINQASK